jgi:hypothetical protein
VRYFSNDMPASEILLTIKTDTKEEEQEILSNFLTRLQYLPTVIDPREQPDFEVEINNRQIGIEVTKYYADFTKRGSKTQQKISEWKKFAESLKSKLSTVDSEWTYLYGAIHFRERKFNYGQLLNENYFDQLAQLIKSVGIKRTDEKTVDILASQFPLLAEHIESIYLRDTYPENIYLWWDSSLQSGQVIQNESALKVIVDKKEESSKKYKQDYFQKWLVIYAGGLGLHDMFNSSNQSTSRQGKVFMVNISEPPREDLFEIKSDYFSHIFVWDKFTEKIIQIAPYRKIIFDYGQKSIWVNHLPLR